MHQKRYFYACLRACLTHISGARGQAVISDFQKRSGRSAKNSSTRTIEKIAFFAKKCKKVQGLYLKVRLKISLNWLHLDSVISEKVQKVDELITQLTGLYNVDPQQENVLSEAQQTELRTALDTLEMVTKKLGEKADESATNSTPVNHELITTQGKDLLVIKDNEGNTVDIMFEGSDTQLLHILSGMSNHDNAFGG